jgi:hypothetical protein
MTWQEQMQRDAGGLAFPNLVLEPGDAVSITSSWSDGFSLSEMTFDPAEFSFSVTVWRDHPKLGRIACDSRSFSNREAADFFAELMAWGSKP